MALPAIGDGEQLGDGNTGEQLNVGASTQAVRVGGSATGNLGFFGTTPIAKVNVANTATTALATATISQVGTSGKWAFASSTVATAYVTRIKQMQVDVKNLITQLDALGLV